MRQHGIVHPDLMERVQPNFYPSRCTVQASVDTDSSTGETIQTWANVDGYEDIPCRITATGTRELRNSDQVYAASTHQISLNGHYAGIRAIHQIIVDGMVYQIEGPPQHDGNLKTTRLFVRKID